jgi:hypothetical protein
MRRRTIAFTSLVVLSAAALGPEMPAGATPVPRLSISAHGLSIAHLGARRSSVQAAINRLLGKPTVPTRSTPGEFNCGVGALESWHAFSVYYDQGRLVGMSLGPGSRPAGETSVGLRLGDTVKHAQSLYGSALHTSTNQGGSWFVQTARGRLDGFLAPGPGPRPTPAWRILTIDAGVVGCPAMSP